jgi:magnesium chelatase family protein
MTVGRTWAVVLTGLHGDLIEVEADLSSQTPAFVIIGLADKAIGEAHQRVHNACANSELPLPRRKLTVNLSPANLPKQGSALDVAIAIAALATEHALDRDSLAQTAHIGELDSTADCGPSRAAAGGGGRGPDGHPQGGRAVREPGGGRPRRGSRGPGAVSLRDVARWHGLDVDEVPLEPVPHPAAGGAPSSADVPDLVDVIGQADAVDALTVAAAGAHHL